MRVPYASDPDLEEPAGTCLPVDDHFLEVTFWEGPSWSIVCPDDGCVQIAGDKDAEYDGTCWLAEWFDNCEVGDLIHGDGNLVVRFSLEVPEKFRGILEPVFSPTKVVTAEHDGQLSIPVPDEIFSVDVIPPCLVCSDLNSVGHRGLPCPNLRVE